MSDTAERPRPYDRFAIAGVLVLAAVLRAWQLGARTLWTDEGSTWTAASLPLQALLRRCVERDASPPLFYLLTSWCLRFGDGEAQLRLVSWAASLALVWLTYRLGRLGLSRRRAAFAALLTALSPYQVMYAQEARTYTLAAAALVAGLYFYARASAGNRLSHWVGLALATAFGAWTQSIALLGISAQAALAVGTKSGRRHLLPWIAALAAGAALYLPWAWYARGVAEHLSSSHWYIPDPDARGVFKVLRAALLSPLPLVTAPEGSTLPGLDRFLPRAAAWLFVTLPVAVALLNGLPELAGRDGRGRLTRVAWAAWFVPVVAVFVISFQRPLFLPRYFVFVTPAVSLLFVLGASALSPRPLRFVAGGWLALLAVLGLVRYQHDYSKEPWRDVTADIRARAAAGRTAVLVPFDVDPFAYYNRTMPQPVRAFEVGHPDEPFAAAYTPRQLEELTEAARRNASEYDEVWVVVRSPNSEVRREVARRAEAVAGEGRALVERRRWDSLTGPLRVSRFVRGGTAPDSLK
ncbi:MAG: glycosyltransferase family 39 protein [Candidatus Eisenbacteria bacterium]